VRDTDTGQFWRLLTVLLTIIALLSAARIAGLIAYLRARRGKSSSESTAVAVLEPT
jgi:hypothetical protein